MDIFQGEAIISALMSFEDTAPLNDKFEQFGYGSSNFMLNSGSFFIIFIAITVYQIGLFIVHSLMTCCPRIKLARKIGIATYSRSYMEELWIA